MHRIFVGEYDAKSKTSWIYRFDYVDSPSWDLYVISFYFTVTTLMTVGYGDITA